jgi:hypothetical protein
VTCGWGVNGESIGNVVARRWWNERPIEDALRAESAALRAELERVRGERGELESWLTERVRYSTFVISIGDATEYGRGCHAAYSMTLDMLTRASAAALVIAETPTEEGGEDE